MKVTTTLISAAAATAITAGGILAASTPNDIEVKPSPGVTAEQLLGVEQVRSNARSNGRAGGKALPRRGGSERKLSETRKVVYIFNDTDIQLVSSTQGTNRTNKVKTSHSPKRSGSWKNKPKR